MFLVSKTLIALAISSVRLEATFNSALVVATLVSLLYKKTISYYSNFIRKEGYGRIFKCGCHVSACLQSITLLQNKIWYSWWSIEPALASSLYVLYICVISPRPVLAQYVFWSNTIFAKENQIPYILNTTNLHNAYAFCGNAFFWNIFECCLLSMQGHTVNVCKWEISIWLAKNNGNITRGYGHHEW